MGGSCCSPTDVEGLTDFSFLQSAMAGALYPLRAQIVIIWQEVPGAISPCPSYKIPCCCFWKGEASKCAGHDVLSCQGFILGFSGTKDTKSLSLQHSGLASCFASLLFFPHPHLEQEGQQRTGQEVGTSPKKHLQELFQDEATWGRQKFPKLCCCHAILAGQISSSPSFITTPSPLPGLKAKR